MLQSVRFVSVHLADKETCFIYIDVVISFLDFVSSDGLLIIPSERFR